MSCWDCKFHQGGNGTFLGLCLYFKTLGKPPKEIPAKVVDEGCKFKKERQPEQVEFKNMEVAQWPA